MTSTHFRLPARPMARVGAITLAVLALAACGGGDADLPDQAAATDSAADDQADRATAQSVGGLPAGPIRLVSTRPSGAAASTSSVPCSVSANGRLALFASAGAEFVSNDTNGRTDVFLKNLDTGTVVRVSTHSDGTQLPAGGSCIDMTPDGRWVSFHSGGAVFVKNLQTGQLTPASPAAGTLPQVRGYLGGALSDDGRRIVFVTQPEQVYVGGYDYANLVPARVVVRDLDSGSLQTLATDNGIVAQGQVIGVDAAISPDGARVAFVSSSPSLVPGDSNGRPDVFVRDLGSGATTLASSSAAGLASTAVQYSKVRMRSSTQVSFATSAASSLGAAGLYEKDLGSGALSLTLPSSVGNAEVLSADGRKVVFTRLYSGFDRRVFVRDLATGQDALVSASASGTASAGNAGQARLSRDGSTVVFSANARNLVSPQPPSGVFQVYAKAIAQAPAVQ